MGRRTLPRSHAPILERISMQTIRHRAVSVEGFILVMHGCLREGQTMEPSPSVARPYLNVALLLLFFTISQITF